MYDVYIYIVNDVLNFFIMGLGIEPRALYQVIK